MWPNVTPFHSEFHHICLTVLFIGASPLGFSSPSICVVSALSWGFVLKRISKYTCSTKDDVTGVIKLEGASLVWKEIRFCINRKTILCILSKMWQLYAFPLSEETLLQLPLLALLRKYRVLCKPLEHIQCCPGQYKSNYIETILNWSTM